jgi:hypothetical protein
MTYATLPVEASKPLRPTLEATARYVLTAGGSYALGRGWVQSDTLQFITGLFVVSLPAWGIIGTYINRKEQRAVAENPAVPDSVMTPK